MEQYAPPLIALRNASRRYRAGDAEVGALNEVSLSICAGEFVAIMGPSGSGKTTLMNLIGCLDRPSSGEYFYQGHALHSVDPDERARLRREAFGFVFQNYNLLGMATARENVEMPAIYAGIGKRARWLRAAKLLSRLGLSHRLGHRPSEMSGGEQQRVAIARALMNGGEVILADEPTGSVDSRSGKDIMEQLAALSEQGRTVIVVTHDPTVARYAHRRIELLDGRVVADTGPDLQAGTRTARTTQRRPAAIRVPALSLGESTRTALRALRGNKLRTALTLLGIVIGVFSVTAMLGVAEGVRREILDTFGQLGGASVTITPHFGEYSQPLTLSDAEAILAQVPGLISVSPLMNGGATLVAGDKMESARVMATSSRAVQERGLDLSEGVFFSDAHDDRYAPVIVLGGLLAGNLFGEQAHLAGQYVLLNGSPYQVIGVLRRGQDRFAAFNVSARSAYVPLRTGALRLFGRDNLDSIEVVVADTDRVEAVQGTIARLLRQHHDGASYQFSNLAEVREAQGQVTTILTLLFGTIGGISLAVAGIGVMNIMLASVAERTREIGLRMATGARRSDILLQFLCEAVLVSGLGGVVGLALAIALGGVINSFGVSVLAFPPTVLLVGLSCATLTGLVFGFAPAKRAANMDPVTALAAH